MQRFGVFGTGCALLLLALSTHAQDRTAVPSPPATPPEGAAPAAVAPDAAPDPTEDLFVNRCSSCHTVGKGDRVGPDLAQVLQRRDRQWVEQIIAAPSALLDRDPTAREMVAKYNGVRMPDLGLKAEEVQALVALLERCSVEVCDLVGKFVPVTQATPADVARGARLFTGHEAIASGAVPCLSCHNAATLGSVPGGTLAVDLTHVYARLGDEGLAAALKNPSFKLMNKVFGDHPLSDAEAFALRAFLYDTNRSAGAAGESWSLLLVGALGAIVAMAVLNAFWRRRLLGVRATIRGKEAQA